MAERSKRRGRKPQVSQGRNLMEGIGGDGCGADGLTDTDIQLTQEINIVDYQIVRC